MCGLFISIGYFCGSIDHCHATHISDRTSYACSFHYRYTYLIRTFHFTAYSTGHYTHFGVHARKFHANCNSPRSTFTKALVASGVQKLSTNRCEVGSVKPVQNEPMNAAPRQQAQKKTMGGHSVATVPFQKSTLRQRYFYIKMQKGENYKNFQEKGEIYKNRGRTVYRSSRRATDQVRVPTPPLAVAGALSPERRRGVRTAKVVTTSRKSSHRHRYANGKTPTTKARRHFPTWSRTTRRNHQESSQKHTPFLGVARHQLWDDVPH